MAPHLHSAQPLGVNSRVHSSFADHTASRLTENLLRIEDWGLRTVFQLYGLRPRNGSSRSKVRCSGFFGCFSPAVNTRSSLRPIRLWAYRPSRTNSAAETWVSMLSFDDTFSALSFSVSPCMFLSPSNTSFAPALSVT